MIISRSLSKRLMLALNSVALAASIYSCAANTGDEEDPIAADSSDEATDEAADATDAVAEAPQSENAAEPAAEEEKPETAPEAPVVAEAEKPAEVVPEVAPEMKAPEATVAAAPEEVPAVVAAPVEVQPEPVAPPPAVKSNKESNPTPQQEFANDSSHGEYMVEPGDTLGNISAKIYGTAAKWKELSEYNQISNPRHMHPGDIVRFPLNRKAQAFYSSYKSRTKQTVQVKAGDTLAKIAQDVLGNSAGWTMLWHWNQKKIANPNRIFAGMNLHYYTSEHSPAVASAAKSELKGKATPEAAEEADDDTEESH